MTTASPSELFAQMLKNDPLRTAARACGKGWNGALPCGCRVEGPMVVIWACREHWWMEGGGWAGHTLMWGTGVIIVGIPVGIWLLR